MGFIRNMFSPIPQGPDPSELERITKAQQQMQPKIPTWTQADEAELEKLQADRAHAEAEARQKFFMSLPEDVRTGVLDRVRDNLIEVSLHQLSNFKNTMTSNREYELIHRKHHGFIMGSMLEKQQTLSKEEYEELNKLHAEASTREILLNDKEK